MLAQNFKSASDLGLTEAQVNALQKTLVLLETGKLRHVPLDDNQEPIPEADQFDGHFNMHSWFRSSPCGTVACIGGTAELISGEDFSRYLRTGSGNPAISDLFEPVKLACSTWQDITSDQAATALRSYLTTGDARWDLAVT